MTSRKLRTLASVLGIAVGIGTVVAIFVIDHNTGLTQERRRALDSARPDIEITPMKPNPPGVLEISKSLERIPGVLEASGAFFNAASVMRDGRPVADLEVCGLEPGKSQAFSAYVIEDGRDLDPGEIDAALLPRALAKKLGVSLGDRLTLRRRRPPVHGCRDGKIVTVDNGAARPEDGSVSFAIVGILAPERLGRRSLIITSFESSVQLFRDDHFLPVYWAKLDKSTTAEEIRRLLEGQELTVTEPRFALAGEAIEEKAFRNGVLASALMALLLGLFIIFNSMSMSLAERIRQIGLLSALGTTRAQISQIFLAEGSLLAFTGGSLGLLVGLLLAWALKAARITTLGAGERVDTFEIPVPSVATIVGLGVLFALLGVLWPLVKARKLSVTEALRSGRADFKDLRRSTRLWVYLILVLVVPACFFGVSYVIIGGTQRMLWILIQAGGVLALVFGVLLFCPSVLTRATRWSVRPWASLFRLESRLAESAMLGSGHRVFTSVTGLMLVFATLLGVKSITSSLQDETRQWAERALPPSLYVRTEGVAREKVEALRKIDGIRSVVPLTAEINSPFTIRGVDPEALARYASPSDRKIPEKLARRGGIVLSEYLARSFGYEVGTIINLPTFDGPKPYEVLAISDAFGFYPDNRKYGLIHEADMMRDFCRSNDQITQFAIFIAPDRPEHKIEEKVHAALASDAPWLAVKRASSVRRTHLREIGRDFFIFDVILMLIVGLSALGMLNSLVIAALERRKEIALLRIVGLTKLQLSGVLLLETVSMGILGGLLAALLGVPVSWIVVKGLANVSGLGVAFELSPVLLIGCVFGAVLVSLVASLLPIRQAHRLDYATAIRYE
ncbi:MAG: FtsX-like permease family protein [Planctomycetota bacterium]